MRHLFRLAILCGAVFAIPGCNGCDDDGDDDPPLPPPAAPSGLAATAITTERIDLSWADNATDETDYRVERSPDGTTWTQIAILPAGSTSAVVRGLTPNTPYFFRVAAANSTTLSAYAGPATTSTLLRTWSTLVSGPGARTEHSTIYDPNPAGTNPQMVVFGGNDGTTPQLNELWVFTLSGTPSWSQVILASPPSARESHSAIYDSGRQRMILFGGLDFMAGPLDEVRTLNLDGSPLTWGTISAAGAPSPRYNHSAIYDPNPTGLTPRMIVFGGNDGGLQNDIYELTLPQAPATPAWSLLATSGTPPPNRENHVAVYDSVLRRMLVFGGNDGGVGGNQYSNEVWALSLSGGTPTWTQLMPTGTAPSPRYNSGGAFDQANERLTLFSGDDFVGVPPPPPLLNDVWILPGSNPPPWTPLSPANPPPGRMGHSIIYDAGGRRLIMFGGNDALFAPLGDVLALQL